MGATITAIVPWFGSKRKLAPKIIEALGRHRTYWEPFAGSMSVLLSKPIATMETVNDLHGDLINLARVVKDDSLSVRLRQACRFELCGDDWLKAANKLIRQSPPPADDKPCVDRAAAYLAASWMGRNGCAGLRESKQSSRLCVRWCNTGGARGTPFDGAIRSLAAWHRRLRTVCILRRDGFDVLSRIRDESQSVIYCDPPYLVKSDEYEHDFAAADHDRLADLLKRFKKTRVVVSYYAHPRLAELYPSWAVIDCATRKNIVNTNSEPQVAPEVLLVNQSEGEGLFA